MLLALRRNAKLVKLGNLSAPADGRRVFGTSSACRGRSFRNARRATGDRIKGLFRTEARHRG